MSVTVQHTGGQNTTANPCVSDSWTSVAGSTIVAIVQSYNMSTTFTAAMMTDSLGNTWVLRKNLWNGISHASIAVYEQVGGTRGAGHAVTFTLASSESNMAVIEMTATLSLIYDPAPQQTAADASTPFNVTANAALAASAAIALYGVVLNCSGNSTWTDPTGYTDIIHQFLGNSFLVSLAAYKIGESGTPTVGAVDSGGLFVVADASEVFVSYNEMTPPTIPPLTPQTDYSAFPKFLLVR